MTNGNTSNISLAFSGGVYIAPLTAIAPKSVSDAFDAQAHLIGYLDESGIVITPADTMTEIGAWPENQIVKTSHSAGKTDAAFKMFEDSDGNMKLYSGQSARNADGGWVINASNFGEHFQLYVRAIDVNAGTQRLWVAPNAELTVRGAITLNATAVTAYDVTVACRYSEAIDGNIVRYDGPWVPVSGS